MVQERLLKWGRVIGCITPAAWAVYLFMGVLYSAFSGNPDEGLFWVWLLVMPMMHVGTVAAPVWLIWAWRRRHVFSKPPKGLAALNAAALLAGLTLEIPLWWGRLSHFLSGF